MRTAIVLLFLLALAAVPGSLLPQRSLSQSNVTQYFADHPDLAPVLDRLYLFDVFQLAVVRRGLPAALRLAHRLRAAAGAGAPPRAARGTPGGAPAPDAPAGRRRADHGSPRRGRPGRGGGGTPGPPVPGGAPRGSCRPRRGISRRPATCCSTCRWWRCCSAWPAASSGATRAASWSPRARVSATPSSSTTPTPPAPSSTAATSPRSASTSRSSARSTSPASPRRPSPRTSATAPRARRDGPRRSASTTRCGWMASGSTSPA